MPTFAAPDADIDREHERRTREAWDGYRAALEGLEGRGYEEAELEAWDLLQEQLAATAR